MPQTVDNINLEHDLLVRDVDGSYKVYNDGHLQPLTATVQQASKTQVPVLPTAFIPQAVVSDSSFRDVSGAGNGDDNVKFGFHPDDNIEIESELTKLNTLLNDGQQRKYSIEKIAHKLVEKHTISLSPDKFARFVKILLSFFRQARSLVAAKEALTGSVETSGLGLEPATAEDILKIARHLKDKIESVDGVVVEASQMGTGSEEPDQQPVVKDPFVARQPAVEKELTEKPKPPQKQSLPVQPKVVEVPKPVTVPHVTQKSEPHSSESLPKVQRPSSDKIKGKSFFNRSRGATPSKLLGKVDELAQINVTEFRMLDDDPRRRAAKILQQIETLAEESITRKSQGIEAWRSSDVYRIYLKMGQASLESAKDIKTLVSEMEARNEEALTVEEFEAITDLNKQLRF